MRIKYFFFAAIIEWRKYNIFTNKNDEKLFLNHFFCPFQLLSKSKAEEQKKMGQSENRVGVVLLGKKFFDSENIKWYILYTSEL